MIWDRLFPCSLALSPLQTPEVSLVRGRLCGWARTDQPMTSLSDAGRDRWITEGAVRLRWVPVRGAALGSS
jgi:hypothetical protein